MTTDFVLGSYVPGTSVIHAMKAQVKIVLTCAFSIGALFMDTWAGLGVAVLALVALYLLARVPVTRGLRGLGPVLFILVFTVVAHSLSLTLEGFLAGVFVAARIALIVFACMLLTFTTPAMGLVDGLLWLLGPLRRLRVPVDDLAMVVSLALRFVPLSAQEAYAVRKAQLSRCADFEARGMWARARAWVPVFVPLMVRLFRRSGELAQAMEARCYSGAPRTQSCDERMTARDWLMLIAALAIITAIAVLL